MIKSILYTKSSDTFEDFDELNEFAEAAHAYYTCLVSETSDLYDVTPGTKILTTKGNTLYVLETSFRRNAFDFAKPSSITEVVEMNQEF